MSDFLLLSLSSCSSFSFLVITIYFFTPLLFSSPLLAAFPSVFLFSFFSLSLPFFQSRLLVQAFTPSPVIFFLHLLSSIYSLPAVQVHEEQISHRTSPKEQLNTPTQHPLNTQTNKQKLYPRLLSQRWRFHYSLFCLDLFSKD